MLALVLLLIGTAWSYVTVSPNKMHFHTSEDNKTFVPIGLNIAWPPTHDPKNATAYYTEYFSDLAANGGNFARIWLGPSLVNSFNPLALLRTNCTADKDAAALVDTVVSAAELHGIKLLLSLDSFNGLCPSFASGNCRWDMSVYNAKNGGPLRGPAGYLGFWTDAAAKATFKALLTFAAERWGTSQAIFGWELFNEVDAAGFDLPTGFYAWHREMAACLRAADKGRHLITESFGIVEVRGGSVGVVRGGVWLALLFLCCPTRNPHSLTPHRPHPPSLPSPPHPRTLNPHPHHPRTTHVVRTTAPGVSGHPDLLHHPLTLALALASHRPRPHPPRTRRPRQGNPAIEKTASFDFTTTHNYARKPTSPDVARSSANWCRRKAAEYGKPSFVGEFGCDDTVSGGEKNFRHSLHAGVWAPLFVGGAGTGMSWFWGGESMDADFQREWFLKEFRGVHKFVGLVGGALARGGRQLGDVAFAPLDAKVLSSSPPGALESFAIMGGAANVSLVWLHDVDDTCGSATPTRNFGGAKVWLEGVPDGDWHITWFDTHSGNATQQVVRGSRGGVTVLTPPFVQDLAMIVAPLPLL
jgi:hypothetical protein